MNHLDVLIRIFNSFNIYSKPVTKVKQHSSTFSDWVVFFIRLHCSNLRILAFVISYLPPFVMNKLGFDVDKLCHPCQDLSILDWKLLATELSLREHEILYTDIAWNVIFVGSFIVMKRKMKGDLAFKVCETSQLSPVSPKKVFIPATTRQIPALIIIQAANFSEKYLPLCMINSLIHRRNMKGGCWWGTEAFVLRKQSSKRIPRENLRWE